MRSEPLLRLILPRNLGLAISLGLSLACSGPPPRAANPARPLDERRAIEVIAEAFRDQSEQPVPGPDVALSPQHPLHMDVLAQGKRFGVAYVTSAERSSLGNALQPRDPNRQDALQVVTGIDADGDARVCVLYETDYLYDDQVGEAHERSTLTAELKLRRDVRDFLVIAHRERMR